MSDGYPFLIPWIDQHSPDRVARVPAAALERLVPPVDGLLSYCVPSPFGEAEVMAILLRALPPQPSAPFEDVAPGSQQQSFQNWQRLVRAMLFGSAEIENVRLRGAGAFGNALIESRVKREFQSVLRCRATSLQTPGRDSRLVGGIDETTLVWGAPRLPDSDWGTLDALVHGANVTLALDLLHAWREMFRLRGLWSAEGRAMPPWMRGVDRMLDGHKVNARWDELRDDVRMAGPVRLRFERNNAPLLLDVYVPVYTPGWGGLFNAVLQLQPAAVDGGYNLTDEKGRVGYFVQTGFAQPVTTPGSATVTQSGAFGAVRDEDSLLAGVGSLRAIDATARGDHWWIDDREGRRGYRSAVYGPLLAKVTQLQGAAGAVAETDMDTCPALFPDTLRLARRQFNPDPGMSGVEYLTLKAGQTYASMVREWLLPKWGRLLQPTLVEPPLDKDWVVALESSPSAPCLLERFERPGVGPVDVGELRALGALLWEIFTGDAEFKLDSKNPAHPIQRTDLGFTSREKIASQATETSSRVVFNDALLASVGSALLGGSTRMSESYRAGVKRRRATAQRFVAAYGARGVERPDGLLGVLAVGALMRWAFQDDDPVASWGLTATPGAASRAVHVTRTLALTVLVDPYPRRRA